MIRFRVLLVFAAALALAVGVTTATAGGGGKSPSAKKCQNGGYLDWVRSDLTTFADADECMAYAAKKGNTLVAKPTSSCAGSENFSGDAAASQPTTFSGGTI